MGNYPVMKCACCEKKLSQIEVLRLSATRSDVIASVLSDELKAIGARGTAQIVEIDQMIVGAIYEYADEQEIARSEEICQAVERVFDDLNDDVERTCDTRLIDVN